MKKLSFIFVLFIVSTAVMAQGYWSSNTDASKIIPDKAVARLSFPKEFKLFNLDATPLRTELFKVVGNASKHTTVIFLPNADGQLEQFKVVEASNFDPALQARFPEIRAFSGRGITDPSATLKLSISPQGIQTMVFRNEKENEFIEAYSKDHTVYAVFKSQRSVGSLPWTCSTPDQQLAKGLNSQLANAGITARSGGDLKTMRLAQSVTAEYSNFFGATSSAQVALVLAAINATLTRCNGCYEKDLAVHLNLVANTDAVIFYDPITDPYSGPVAGAGGAWHGELQSTLTSNIGEANYDIGHLFGASGGGGNAGCIGCICVDGSKGRGFTSPADAIPQGDNFDIDYVTHEVGHQMGGNHTFSHDNEGNGVSKEVGSGITIMAYAGITNQDVAPHSIDIYHEASIAQIQANLAGKSCPVTTNISANNATPTVSAGSDYTIPFSTPFALTGSASDADEDPITYCWEQNDDGTGSQTGANSIASPTKSPGPNWLSFSPTTSPTRLFPKLATILAGSLVSGPLPGGDAGVNTEALSSVGRTLNFRLTVRDNAPFSSTAPVTVGQTQFDDMVVTVDGSKGPFAVISPNTAVTMCPGSQTITWSVNGSDALAANVKISLSYDGGNTFPVTLTASTSNDGSAEVTLPCTFSSSARIKIEAVGNIFFDISNANFTVGDNTKPTFTDPDDVIIFKDANCNYNASTAVTGDVTDEADNCDNTLNATSSDLVTPGSCVGETIITRTWTLSDDCGNTTVKQQTITIRDNTPPTFTEPDDITIYKDENCEHDASVAVTGDVTNEADNCDPTLNATFTDVKVPGSCIGNEIITRTWTLSDDCGNSTSHIQVINVRDTTRPSFSNVGATPNVLWPPNHKMRDVTINYTAVDNCSPVTSFLTVTSNEAVNGNGDGNTSPDWIVIDDHHVQLRAERAGNGNGRIYTIKITSTDDCGNVATTTTTVSVPHDMSARGIYEEGDIYTGFSVKVLPNPSTDNFTLRVNSDNGQDKILLTVYDVNGRKIEERSVVNNGTISFGGKYISGTYIAKVTQGTETREVKLFKIQ